MVDLPTEVHLSTVGQVTTSVHPHPEDLVTRLKEGLVDSHVGLGTGVWLNVDVFSAEQLLGVIDGQLFDLVNVLTPTVVTLARVPLCVLVGQN